MPETRERKKRAPGGGRKPLPLDRVKSRRVLYLTQAEHEKVQAYITSLRNSIHIPSNE